MWPVILEGAVSRGLIFLTATQSKDAVPRQLVLESTGFHPPVTEVTYAQIKTICSLALKH
jgi:hypothetical protein